MTENIYFVACQYDEDGEPGTTVYIVSATSREQAMQSVEEKGDVDFEDPEMKSWACYEPTEPPEDCDDEGICIQPDLEDYFARDS